MIDHPSFLFPKTMLSDFSMYEENLKAYELYIFNTAVEMISTINRTEISLKDIKHDAFEIVKFETKLVNIMHFEENHDDLANLFKKVTIGYLQFLTDLIPRQNGDTRVNWEDIINTLLQNTNITVTEDDYIVVKDLRYIIKLINLIESTPPRIIANYIGWNIVKHFSRDTTKKLQKISFSMDQILHGVTEDIARKQYCTSVVNKHVGFAVAHEYVDKYLDLEVKQGVREMMENIKSVLLLKLKSLKWLDEETKSKAVDKAKAIGMLVGYPNWLRNKTYLEEQYKGLEITKYHILNIISCHQFKKQKELLKLNAAANADQWSGLPTDVNAYYNVLQNIIVFPAGILQYPFYNSKRMDSINYGAIGTTIGHEFSHAFDNTGRQADKNGNLIQWWSEESLKKYQENIKCFREHYNKYITDFVQNKLQVEIETNPLRTQDENIADIIGLELAYHAYLNMKKLELGELKLPGLEKYTSDQYFFLSYANQWCEVSSTEQLMSDLMEGTHTPTRIRVLGALSNSEAFNKAFNCPINSAMNPNKKCNLW